MKVKSKSEVAQLCLTLCDPMDSSPPGSSVHGIFQARVLEWGAIAFSAWTSYDTLLLKFILMINIVKQDYKKLYRCISLFKSYFYYCETYMLKRAIILRLIVKWTPFTNPSPYLPSKNRPLITWETSVAHSELLSSLHTATSDHYTSTLLWH